MPSKVAASKRPKNFLQWLTNETIGVVILTSICALTIQNSFTGLQSIFINHLASKAKNETWYWNRSNNTIAYLPISEMNKNYTTPVDNSISSNTTTTQTVNNPAAVAENFTSNFYVITPHVFYSLLWIFLQIAVNLFIAYMVYRIFVSNGMRPFLTFSDERQNQLEEEEVEELPR